MPTIIVDNDALNATSLNPHDPLTLAVNQIYDTFGDQVSIVNKAKTLRKFGRNAAVGGSFETVWQTGGDETYATDNTIDSVSSSSADDTQVIQVEGHTISGGLLTFVVQTVTLTGQTPATLTTPLARLTRVFNAGTTDFAGTIYGFQSGGTVTNGVPQTAADIHITVTEGNQGEKASTSISKDDYYIITEAQFFVFTKTAENVEFIGEIREVGTTNKVFRRIYSTVASAGVSYAELFYPPFIIPPNYDIRVRARSDGTSVDVGASFNGYLAIKVPS